MRAIFISYRREDAEGQAGRLFNDLASEFGSDAVFMDVGGIEPGRDFRRIIDEHVASCGVLLAIIGKSWINAQDNSGRRRLDDPMDFVRLETASALKRDIPVIPVLVQGASMPRAEQLTPDLADLAFRNGVELTHARWESDVQVLIKALRPHVQERRLELDREKAKAGANATQASGTGRAVMEPGAQTTGPAVIGQPIISFRVIVTALGAVIALSFPGYVWYSRSSTAPEIATSAEAPTAANGRPVSNEPKAKTQSDQTAPAELQADQLSKKQAADEIEAARLATKEKRDGEAKIRAKQAADRAEADRLAAKEAADKTEADALAKENTDREAKILAAEKAAATHAARWPSYDFPPPNGGPMVFTIMPDGNPACASYDGANCLWGLSYDQIDFTRLEPLVCGEGHRARWSVTGYEDPKHWCNLARKVSGIRK